MNNQKLELNNKFQVYEDLFNYKLNNETDSTLKRNFLTE